MPPDIHVATKLGKLIRLLSSDKDHECLGAARALCRAADIHAVAGVIEKHWKAPATQTEFDLDDMPWRELAAHILKFHEYDPAVVWGPKERNFLHNIKRSRTAPSAGQEKWLHDINLRRRRAA